MTNDELHRTMADLLREQQRNRNRMKEARAEMLRLAVEDLGMDQKEAIQANLETFFDGYLVGRGVYQSWREEA